MEHYFELPINHNGEELLLNGRLVTFAFNYKYYIVINGRELIFEQDDEQNFRVIAAEPDQHVMVAPELIENIVAVLQELQARKAS